MAPSNKEILLEAVAETAGPEVLRTVDPKEVKMPVDTPFDASSHFIPTCRTQKRAPAALKAGPFDIMVGLGSEIPRWEPGSVIRYSVWKEGFNSEEDATYAAEHLAIAAKAWNDADVGVTFEWVKLTKDATFVLCYGGEDAGTLASAFFPNDDDLNFVYVYADNFEQGPYKTHMWKVFVHELGHVLGLRHEFALESEGEGAVQFGPRDELSVMNYRDVPPELQQSDIDSTKKFYALKNRADGKPPKISKKAVKNYIPM